MVNPIIVNGIRIGRPHPFVLIAGPCVIEDDKTTFNIALKLKQLTEKLSIPFIFKASYDKANRTSIDSYRGPGMNKGIELLRSIKNELNVPIISDVHQTSEVELAAQVLDVIQIPAFLCRQTDLLLSAAATGKVINIKKGQFLAPWDMVNVVKKVSSTGNTQIVLTERGVSFGYNNLVSDFRSIKILQETGYPVIFDATHSVQLPGGAGTSSTGQREFAPVLAKAAIAVGADGIFLETHSNPDKALSDGPNSIQLENLENILIQLKAIENALNDHPDDQP